MPEGLDRIAQGDIVTWRAVKHNAMETIRYVQPYAPGTGVECFNNSGTESPRGSAGH
uniref:Uncharacterized protein n=1 Tax=mine drainage metagenome TaxID=410659 RepID=E6Q9K1_9ZZZZ